MFISNPKNKILLSILWGFGLSMIFRKMCTEDCTLVIPVLPKDIEGKLFKHEDSCYSYSAEVTDCTPI